MSETFKLITNTNASGTDRKSIRRAAAVASALELILASVQKSGGLEGELENLSAYADKIEEALNQ
ncbi:hypothetical protein [Pseudomonas sp. NC02]|uniref:hypothetical protein n=1 Tax=Pseudomonas sp. NC02 TaxID=2067572 RepID=UPI000C85C7D3|nr:hypothetical protein [Pseudomonas sp. NC02]AUO23230.1 hypothetical protein C0058_15060 [Pseudomonas sp. NC02]